MSEGLTKLGKYRDGSVKIMTFRTGEGCGEGCAHCGAYSKGVQPGDLLVKGVTRDRMRACLQGEFVLKEAVNGQGLDSPDAVKGEVRKRLADLLANYVTTDVNQEPLNSDTFLDFSDLVKELTGGKSRAVCISHGLRVSADGKPANEDAARRLDALAEKMDDGDVFVLSLDLARSQGGISHDVNLRSYAETLNRLKPALEKDSRITVSIQGVDDPSNAFHRLKATNLYDEVKEVLKSNYGWKDSELTQLFMDTGRSWVSRGRAEGLPGVDPDGECPVIPDTLLVQHTLDKPTNAAFVDFVSGRIFVAPNNLRRSYNDVVRLGRYLSARGASGVKIGHWDEVSIEYSGLVDDLTAQFSIAARVAAHHDERKAARKRRKPGPATG